MSNLLQITLDGTASSGKSTVAQSVAKALNINYVSSGKIFRAYALGIKGVDYKNEKSVIDSLKNINLTFDNGLFFVNGKDVTNKLTSNELSMPASIISAYKNVREKYINDIRKIIEHSSIIIDGRDIGTVVLPNAKYKFYLDAEQLIRTKRRANEIGVKFDSPEFQKLYEEIKTRDFNDKNRKISPLSIPKGAIVIDSSNMSVTDVTKLIVDKVNGAK